MVKNTNQSCFAKYASAAVLDDLQQCFAVFVGISCGFAVIGTRMVSSCLPKDRASARMSHVSNLSATMASRFELCWLRGHASNCNGSLQSIWKMDARIF